MSVNEPWRRFKRGSHRQSPPSSEKSRLYPSLVSGDEPSSYKSDDADGQFYTEDSSSSSIEKDHESESDHFDGGNGSPTKANVSKRSNRSYEDRRHHTAPQQPETGNIGLQWILPMIILFVFLWILWFYLHSAEPDIPVFKRYRQQMGRLLKEKYPNEQSNTKNVLRLIGEKWIDQEPKEPYVVLIGGSRARDFASDITAVFKEVLQRGEVDTIYCNSYKERHVLDADVASSLSKPSRTVVLNDIDRLRGDAPLSLHSLCDPDHSSHPSALVLLTITRSNLGPFQECEQNLSSFLLEEWETGFLDRDRIAPILSRITSYVICLED